MAKTSTMTPPPPTPSTNLTPPKPPFSPTPRSTNPQQYPLLYGHQRNENPFILRSSNDIYTKINRQTETANAKGEWRATRLKFIEENHAAFLLTLHFAIIYTYIRLLIWYVFDSDIQQDQENIFRDHVSGKCSWQSNN